VKRPVCCRPSPRTSEGPGFHSDLLQPSWQEGRTVVTVRGSGVGGRNQELALALAVNLSDVEGFVAASMGTDGIDGPTDAAGAVVTDDTLRRAAEKRLNPEEYLENNDSHTFFKKVGGLIYTGPTGTNVGDITILLV